MVQFVLEKIKEFIFLRGLFAQLAWSDAEK